MTLRTRSLIAGSLGLLAVAVLVVLFNGGTDRMTATAQFEQTVNLYVNDEVRVLGVPVGRVRSVTPAGTHVDVELEWDADVAVPADVRAAVVTPSLVSGRYVQLSPPWTDGPTLESGSLIPIDRTHVPVEWDDIKEQLSRISVAMGPQGANAEGALSRLVDVAAANLEGQGSNLNDALLSVSAAMDVFAEGRNDLVGTIQNLDVFVAALNESDVAVEAFTERLATVSAILDDNRDDLALALAALNAATTDVTAFVQENRVGLVEAIEGIESASRVLAARRNDIALTLHLAPTGLANLYNIYEPEANGQTGVPVGDNFADPATMLCSMIDATELAPAEAEALCAEVLSVLLDPIISIAPAGSTSSGQASPWASPFGPSSLAGAATWISSSAVSSDVPSLVDLLTRGGR